ncbi:UDP-2-acetamido-2,6-beta-L-arabino-hexul-4-ose reductase [Devosia enhydra]|uniref:UDP-2-acetamido-2,6-beta-L-arabino-hexul-4-ose reductase n=1 Tax=Devosia enhydra TaxID=665118 RepID=A0A1K2HUP1_9HYPH|nr:NAD-dependent epimerase/dehydratase family protein [Devosia enhydra]SFZ82197.1 UDP-2-acetamido-2,6-beta-L-arabino-hexul-4-ose reductase [Devosia enhydra]
MSAAVLRVGVTGAGGFIGSNLMLALSERGVEAVGIPHKADDAQLSDLFSGVDLVVHLAGVNRPADPAEFWSGNVVFTQRIVDALAGQGRIVPLVLASSIQAARDTPYGRSKRDAEDIVRAYGLRTGAPVHVLRLPNVFGKWCRPDYNSVVATFCHNIARGLPVRIDDPAAEIGLLYIDDLIDAFVSIATSGQSAAPGPVHRITIGSLADQIRAFRDSRTSLVTAPVGSGLVRALHATYLSYVPPQNFAYPLRAHEDQRGLFAEFLKTGDSGQVSVFTALPGVTRGGHYHHSKTEKFLVVQGQARFRFRHMVSGETHALETSSDQLQVVETVPGWSHDVTNIGPDQLIVVLWANELFDPARPDTIAAPLR